MSLEAIYYILLFLVFVAGYLAGAFTVALLSVNARDDQP